MTLGWESEGYGLSPSTSRQSLTQVDWTNNHSQPQCAFYERIRKAHLKRVANIDDKYGVILSLEAWQKKFRVVVPAN